MSAPRKHGAPAALALLILGFHAEGRAERAALRGPPWSDQPDLPTWAASVVPRRGDMILLDAPSRTATRRGVSMTDARLPFFGQRRGSGCAGTYFQVGARAWTCSDMADLSPREPWTPGEGYRVVGEDALPFSYFFAGSGGTATYRSIESAMEGIPHRELEAGFSVAIVEERKRGELVWGRTSKGEWVNMREVYPARPSPFEGHRIEDAPFGWVVAERASVFSSPSGGAAKNSRARQTFVTWNEEAKGPWGTMVHTREGDWMALRDLVRPKLEKPPADVTEGERWIDVELATQTLVAYEGAKPVFATLVSTGRGPKGTDSATPPGVFRIWVKIAYSTMDNAERDDLDKHYSMEEVPYVMFFHKAFALHGTYWHRDFGRMKSHGCVNLSPKDARFLFEFTRPHAPIGWHAVFPTSIDPGTVIRVR